jgi:hypothetical protein
LASPLAASALCATAEGWKNEGNMRIRSFDSGRNKNGCLEICVASYQEDENESQKMSRERKHETSPRTIAITYFTQGEQSGLSLGQL